MSVPFSLLLAPLENDDFQCFAALFVRFWGFGRYVLVVSLDPEWVSLFQWFTVGEVSLDTRMSKC